MLRSILALAVVCCAAAPAARAENWQVIGRSMAGDIFEVDVDSIDLGDRAHGYVVYANFSMGGNEYVQFFDCHGHAEVLGSRATRIPHQSILETMETFMCARRDRILASAK